MMLLREETDKPLLIAMSGYGQPEDKQRRVEAGFEHHLVKPIDPVQLQNLLSEFGQLGQDSRA